MPGKWRRWFHPEAVHAGGVVQLPAEFGIVDRRYILIREFQYPGDYEQVVELWREMEKGVRFNRSDVPGELKKKLDRDPDLFLVAEANGAIVGTVMGGFDGRRGMLYHLAVAAPYRRRGIAGKLMTEVERRLIAKGCLKCYLLVHADNEEARAFYRETDWDLMDDLVIFGKELA
jgi:ribosomal protein S18 acetylase RimI-like enzyme